MGTELRSRDAESNAGGDANGHASAVSDGHANQLAHTRSDTDGDASCGTAAGCEPDALADSGPPATPDGHEYRLTATDRSITATTAEDAVSTANAITDAITDAGGDANPCAALDGDAAADGRPATGPAAGRRTAALDRYAASADAGRLGQADRGARPRPRRVPSDGWSR